MAKLPRVTAKVFASNAPQDKIGQFGSAKAGTKVNTSDISTIQGLPAFTTGWTEAVVQGQNYPTLEEMNGLQKVFSQQTAYLFEQGIPEYDTNTTYYVGSVCKVATANSLTFYVSKVDNNVGNVVTNTSFWLAFPMYSKNEVISFGLPDYTKGVNLSTKSGDYVIPVNAIGYVKIHAGRTTTIKVNDADVLYQEGDVNYYQPIGGSFIIPKNATVTLSANVDKFVYYPMQGESDVL